MLTPLKEILYRHNAEKAEAAFYAKASIVLYVKLKEAERKYHEFR